ncbi:MAG: Tol-Pal system beta propeller repeat protein TolB [Nitrospirota bacterium]|nr:MAG: Tol-Pal system beta propeller repeat protein TolB [Nitrospirota bacterium]
MKKLSIIICVIILGIVMLTNPDIARAKIYIEIDSPMRQFPMAFYDFAEDDIGQDLTNIVKDDLNFTRLFHFVDKDAYIEEKSDDFNPLNWTPFGIEAVLKGDITVTDKVNVVVRLYDVVETRIILYKQYRGGKEQLRTLAHQISDDIYEALTGQKGIFSTRIAFVTNSSETKQLVMMDFDGKRLKKLPFRKEMMMSPHASDDGSKLIVSASDGRQWSIYLVDLLKESSEKIFESKGVNIAGDFLPDGDRFVFTSSKSGSPDIFLFDISSKRTRRITSNYWINISPTISPDSNNVAFVSDKSGNPHIYIMDIDGYSTRRVTFEGTYNTQPAWSPVGDLIAYSGMIDGKNQIFTARTDGSEYRQLTDEGNNEDPSFSPDGRFIVFTSDREGNKTIYVMTTGGENQKRISPDGYRAFGPEWLSN